jgi:hypothetical protein
VTRARPVADEGASRLVALAPRALVALVVLVAGLWPALVEASLPGASAASASDPLAAVSLDHLTLPRLSAVADPTNPSGFALFAGDELGRALGQGDDATRFALGLVPEELDVDGLALASRVRELGFHPLQGLDLVDTESLRGPPPSEPKTRIGGLELSEPFLQREQPRLSLGLRWGCGPDSCEIASEQRFDPLGLASGAAELAAARRRQGGSGCLSEECGDPNEKSGGQVLSETYEDVWDWVLKKTGGNYADREWFEFSTGLGYFRGLRLFEASSYAAQKGLQGTGKLLDYIPVDGRRFYTPSAFGVGGLKGNGVVRTEKALEGGGQVVELSKGGQTARYVKDALGRPVEAEMEASVRVQGRVKGPRPEPPGGLVPGEHRGHRIPEGTAAHPELVNVPENMASEAAGSNLGPKKSFDNLLARLKAANPSSNIYSKHRNLFKADEMRPYAAEHIIVKDGQVIHQVVIPNQ